MPSQCIVSYGGVTFNRDGRPEAGVGGILSVSLDQSSEVHRYLDDGEHDGRAPLSDECALRSVIVPNARQ